MKGNGIMLQGFTPSQNIAWLPKEDINLNEWTLIAVVVSGRIKYSENGHRVQYSSARNGGHTYNEITGNEIILIGYLYWKLNERSENIAHASAGNNHGNIYNVIW